MSNAFDALKASEDYAGDISQLRDSIPFLQRFRFSELEIERLYERFSDSRCAGWLCLSDKTIQEFAEWLER